MIKSKFPGRAEPNTSHFQALLLIIARWMLAWLLKIILNFMVNEQVVVEVERHINNGHVIPACVVVQLWYQIIRIICNNPLFLLVYMTCNNVP